MIDTSLHSSHWVGHLLSAVFAALIFSWTLATIFGWRREGSGMASLGATVFFLFVLLLLPIWALSAWVGPMRMGSAGGVWLISLGLGLVLTLLILAIAPRRDPPKRTGGEDIPVDQARRESRNAASISLAFWFSILVALVLEMLAYVLRP